MKTETKEKTAEQEIYEMLTENTGAAMCDSGGAYGQHWEHNKGRTLEDFRSEPQVFVEWWGGKLESYSISVFHYLVGQLELDAICREFNQVNCAADDWDDDRFYGVSAEGGKVLDKYGVEGQGEGFNTYNGEDLLTQTLQGQYVQIGKWGYVVLQIHGGCDVRGGYTTARLFRLSAENEYDRDFWCLAPQDVYGIYTPPGIGAMDEQEGLSEEALEAYKEQFLGAVIRLSNGYDGVTLTNDEDYQPVEILEDGKLELWLPEN